VARAVAVIPLVADAHAQYAALALGSPASASRLTAAAHEVARKTLNLEDVRRHEIPLPTLESQRAIAAELDAALAGSEALADAVETAVRRSASLRRSVLASALRGELVAQDPGDEPASALLDRFAAERMASNLTRKRKKARP
jgi:type I restriction enzyme S subunit